MIPSKEQNPKGFHQKYNISKVSGEPLDEGAEYFVLRIDSGGGDPKHIEACRKAVITYALAIKSHLPDLSQDLMDKVKTLLDE